ncbi:unnamed protein product [Chrysoparadoxa australica]
MSGRADMDVEEDQEEVAPEQVPDLTICKRAFVVYTGRGTSVDYDAVMSTIKEKKMGPWYSILCSMHPAQFKLDQAVLKECEESNAATLKKIEEECEEAIKDAGDMEILDAMFAKARHFARIGDKAAAFTSYGAILERPKISTGKKIDAEMERARVALFHHDLPAFKEAVDSAKKLIELGGDWDRRNRLKVYEAMYLITCRDMKAAAELLLESVATFTCVELFDYKQFVFYLTVTSVLSLPRTTLKKRIVDGPEVLSVMPEMPVLDALVHSLYECEYKRLMNAMVDLNEQLLDDRYFGKHTRYIIREMRILSYTQFLDAYKSVILSSMAQAFGVGDEFLDAELSRFIAAGRLNAKIDKVEGVIETNRPDKKNAQYHSSIAKGDMLLNKIQKLARLVVV